MEPFHFGPNAELFGMFHSPTGTVRNKGVLIVPPLFSDAMRTHRVLRQVALRLSERGVSVLRFDLRGTGNSFGDLACLTRRDWVEDVSMAVDELRDIGSVDRLAVLGVRFSVPVVAEAIAGHTVDEAVFWDPPGPGQGLFQSTTGRRPPPGGPGIEFQGFRVGEALRAGWETLPIHPNSHARRTLVLTSGRAGTHSDEVRTVDVDCDWEGERLDEPIYSRDLVDTLCNAF